MTIPRSAQIDLSVTPFYHCMSRCVRGSFLTGKDHQTGKDFTHRKAWIEALIKELARGFSIQICSYAIMSNHYHIVLRVDNDRSCRWTDEKIIQQWQIICPASVKRHLIEKEQGKHKSILQDEIDEWRSRLTNVSWFMRILNERIARMANKEDKNKGRFWDGRFKSQAILDETSLLSAMVYVDLNPIRAQVAATLEDSLFTSVRQRIKHLKAHGTEPADLIPLNYSSQSSISLDIGIKDYLYMVDEIGRSIRDDKRGYISAKVPQILESLSIDPDECLDMIQYIETDYAHAVGTTAMLRQAGYRKRRSMAISA
jgi:REP element-mobilizing transposase RayT